MMTSADEVETYANEQRAIRPRLNSSEDFMLRDISRRRLHEINY